MRHEHLQRRLRDWKGAARGVQKAVSDAELGKTALSRQIRLASGRGQADVKELGHTLLEDSELRLCSSCSGREMGTGEARGANVRNRCTCERERASAMELRRPRTWVADTQNK